MRLTVLGAGPAYTDRVGATGAAYLVQSDGASILLDFGQGSFPALASCLEPSELDAVVVSHLHPDHFIDLVPLRHYLRYEFEPPRRVAVHAPGELGARLDALHADPAFTTGALDLVPLAEGERQIGSLTVEARCVTHTAESYGFRVTDGRGPGLVYSGDCARADDLLPLVRPGDVLLTEVAFGPGPVAPGAGHLDGPAVRGLAAKARPSRVLLTHLQMGFDPEATIASVVEGFDGPVTMVKPGDEFEI
jgi:ribonuclease BN (tRNA processing enzyme)